MSGGSGHVTKKQLNIAIGKGSLKVLYFVLHIQWTHLMNENAFPLRHFIAPTMVYYYKHRHRVGGWAPC